MEQTGSWHFPLLCLICTYKIPLNLGTTFSSQKEGSGQGPCLDTPMCGSMGWTGPPLSLSLSLPSPILSLRTILHLFGLPCCSCQRCAAHDQF